MEDGIKKISQEMNMIKQDTIDWSAAKQIKEAAVRLAPESLEYDGTIAVHIYKPRNLLNLDKVTYTFMTHILCDKMDMVVAKEACEALFGSVKEAYGFTGKNRPEIQ